MWLWVSHSLETSSSRARDRSVLGGRDTKQERLTMPELVFVVEVIGNLVFHATDSFISSLNGLARGKRSSSRGTHQRKGRSTVEVQCIDSDLVSASANAIMQSGT